MRLRTIVSLATLFMVFFTVAVWKAHSGQQIRPEPNSEMPEAIIFWSHTAERH